MMRIRESGEGQAVSTKAARRFDGFKPEGEETVRKADVREMPMHAKIIALWHGLDFPPETYGGDMYDEVLQALGDLRPSAADVGKFIEHLRASLDAEHDGKDADFLSMAGVFISALVNQGSEEEYDLRLQGLLPLHDLAYENRKKVVIHGDVGDSCATFNHGRVEVIGDAGDLFACSHEGGDAILFGDCEGDAGTRIYGGTVTVHGSAADVGTDMEGGILCIKGMVYGEVGENMLGGEIRIRRLKSSQCRQGPHAGRLIVNGVIVFDNGWTDSFADERLREKRLLELSKRDEPKQIPE